VQVGVVGQAGEREAYSRPVYSLIDISPGSTNKETRDLSTGNDVGASVHRPSEHKQSKATEKRE
jgi:hypothetical protein